MEKSPRIGEEVAATVGTDGTDVRDAFSVEPGLDRPLEVILILDDPRDDQRQLWFLGNLDRLGGAFLGMNPSEEEQVVARPHPRLELVHVDPVVNRRHVVQVRVAVGVANRHVVTPRVVLLEDRHDQLG